MSGIKKAVKKVFRGAKRVLKKVAKPALILGATFFVSGLAVGKFEGFSNIMGGDPSNIFKAVGKTIGLGAQAIGGMLNITEGVSPAMAQAYGNEALAGKSLLSGLLGPATPSAETVTEEITEEIADKGKEIVRGGILGKFSGMSDMAQYAIVNGVMTGLSSWAASEEAAKERKRQRRQSIFGVPIGEEFGPGISSEQIYAQIQPSPYAPQMPQPMAMPTAQQAGFANPYISQPSQPPAPRRPLLG